MGVSKRPATGTFGRVVFSDVGAQFKRGADSGHGSRAANVFAAGRRCDSDGSSRLEWPIDVEPAL